MKKSIIAFGAASLMVAAVGITAAVVLGGNSARGGQSSVPDFIMPENTTSAAYSSQAASAAASESSAAQPDTAPSTAAVLDADPTDNSALTADAPSAVSESPDAPVSQQTTASAHAGTTIPETTATAATTSSIPAATAPTGTTSPATAENPEPVTVPENVLVTSGDPLHHIRFEFGEDRIRYSGVYSSANLTEIRLFRPNVRSADISHNGSSFSGSLDISGLEPGYYIIIARLDNNEGMYYVFEKTADGSRAVPADVLPAAANLEFTNSPLELPPGGVLQYITTSGNSSIAASVLDKVKSLSDQICAGLDSDYDKARALCAWVAENMYYDRDAAANGVSEEEISLEFVLQYHRSVCFGWANLYSALCQAQGINCFNVSGSVVTGSRCFAQTEPSDERSHSWNLLEIDGRLIWVDTVWNSSNSYDKGNYFTGGRDMQYFDIDEVLLSNDHRIARLEHRDYFGILG